MTNQELSTKFMRRVQLAREEFAEQIAHSRERGRHLLIDNPELIASFANYLRMHGLPKTKVTIGQKNVYFPDSMVELMGGFDNESHRLNQDLRARFARDCEEMIKIPEYGIRGW